MLDFDKYCEILKKWVKDGYPCVTDNVLRSQIAEFENNLYNQEKLDDANAKKQRDEINNIIKPVVNCNEYNIIEYYKRILQKYGIDEQYIEKFANINKDVKLDAEAPTHRLYNEFIYGYEENNQAHNIMHPIVTDIINNIISVPTEPNISLSKSLEENPIVICYEIGKYSACMAISLIEGKDRPTLIIRTPEDNIPNIDSLASTICHELGHWLDFSSRGYNNYYEARDLAECFADIIGAKLAQNTGYNFESFIERISGFIEEFNTPEMQKYKNIAQKRYDLINQIYKK